MSFIFKDGMVALLQSWVEAGGQSHVHRSAGLFYTSTVCGCGHQGIARSQLLLGLSAGTLWELLLFSDVWQAQHLKAPLGQGWCYSILSQGAAISSCQVLNTSFLVPCFSFVFLLPMWDLFQRPNA